MKFQEEIPGRWPFAYVLPIGHYAQGNIKGYSSGLLELRHQDSALLGVSIQLMTGQILLRAGITLQDSPEVAMHIRGVHLLSLRYSTSLG